MIRCRCAHAFSVGSRTVKFIECGSSPPQGHITGTMCRPDLVAIPASRPSNASHLSVESQSSEVSHESQSPGLWSDIGGVVEFVSKGTTTSGGTKQSVAYTAYLLQQRPDRVAVCGLYINAKHFSLVLVDAANAYSTTLRWDNDSARELLFRVLYYINNPPESMIDPTITREGGTFTIEFQGQHHKGYTLQSCGQPVGRRTVIFRSKGGKAPVIKEQYLRCAAESLEKTILNRVHEPGEMPGVVRVLGSGWVKRAKGTSIECGMGLRKRQKVRFVLQDEGNPFMEITTPYDALVTAWDALEGRGCYLICKLLLTCQN